MDCIRRVERSVAPYPLMSRPSERFLIEPSRKFLLTAVRQKDGTNRDEPRGTRLVGLVEAGPGREDDAAGSGRADGGEPALGANAVEADAEARRRGGSAWVARTAVESKALGRDPETGPGNSETAGLA